MSTRTSALADPIPHGISAVRVTVDYAFERGIPAEVLLRDTDLRVSDLYELDMQVSRDVEITVSRALLEALDNESGLGVAVGVRCHLNSYGGWIFALASCPTLRDALRLGMRYADLSYAHCYFVVDETPDVVHIHAHAEHIPADVRPYFLERDAAGFVTMQRELFGGIKPLRRLELSVPAPSDIEPYEHAFGIVPVFGERTVADVDPAVLDLAMPQADPHGLAIWQRECEELLARRQGSPLVSHVVRDHVIASLPHMPDQIETAAALARSPRSLRRQLQDEGTSYRAVVEEARRTLAEEMLASGGESVSNVAIRLGYSDAAAFVRAFARWTGTSPGRWSRRHLLDD